MTKQTQLNKQAQEILKMAEEAGAQSNFFFATTFKKYLAICEFADELEKEAKRDRKTLGGYAKSNAVEQYGRNADRIVKLTNVLIRIIKEFEMKNKKKEKIDPLLKLVNGGEVDE